MRSDVVADTRRFTVSFRRVSCLHWNIVCCRSKHRHDCNWKRFALRTSAQSDRRREHPRTRAFIYACSLPVTWQDGSHMQSICRSGKSHAARKLYSWWLICFIERKLLRMEFVHCRNRNGSCDLNLDPMTFIDELDPHCLELYRMYKQWRRQDLLRGNLWLMQYNTDRKSCELLTSAPVDHADYTLFA